MPALAMTGDLDFVTASSIHLPIINKVLAKAGNQDVTTIEMPYMNHWLQSCKTGAMKEYGALQEGMSPLALKQMTDWITAKGSLIK